MGIPQRMWISVFALEQLSGPNAAGRTAYAYFDNPLDSYFDMVEFVNADLAQPPDNVLEIIEDALTLEFRKEDGELTQDGVILRNWIDSLRA